MPGWAQQLTTRKNHARTPNFPIFGPNPTTAVFQDYNSTKATVITDIDTGVPRGFGFVEFASVEDLERAIAEMHNKDLFGWNITVKRAVPKKSQLAGGGQDGGGRPRPPFRGPER